MGYKDNYIQSFCEPYAQIDLMEQIDAWAPKKGVSLQNMREDSMTRINDAVEKMLFYGQPLTAGTTDAAGRPIYMSGGLGYFLNTADTFEGIAAWTTGASGTDLVNGDGTSRIWVPDVFNQDLVEKFIERAFLYGNRTKFGFVGRSFMRQWRKVWGPRVEFEQNVTDYGITINSHTIGDCKINFVYAPAMDIEDPTGMFLVDLPYTALAVMNEIHPRDEIQEKASRVKQYDYIADVGFDGQFLKTHSYIKNLPDVAP
jgi:hypothetical protein